MSVVLGTTMASPADVPVRAGTEVPNLYAFGPLSG